MKLQSLAKCKFSETVRRRDTRSSVFTNGAANSAWEYGPKKRPNQLLREQREHCDALDGPKNVGKPYNCYQQTYHCVTVAPQPVQVALSTSFSHEQHDARAAVERRHRKPIKCSQQQIEEKENP